MISDKTIDTKNAKFWCLFCDDKLRTLLDDAASKYTPADGEKFAELASSIAKSKQFKESQQSEKKEASILKEMSWDTVNAMHQAAFPMATGNPFLPNFRGLDPNSGVPSLQDQQKNNVIAGAIAAGVASTACAPGVWAALGSMLASAGGVVGGFMAAAATSAGAAIASLGSAGVAAIIAGVASVASWLYPRLAKCVNDMLRHDIAAICLFEADGERYKAVFSLSEKRWELLYGNNRWYRRGTTVNPVDVSAFFDTLFFKDFLSKCLQKINLVFQSQDRMKVLEVIAEMAEGSTKKKIQKLIDAKATIDEYMFTSKFKTA